MSAPSLDTMPVHFLCGLRSGNTLLANLLAQHPDVHATPTESVDTPIRMLRDNWWRSPAWTSQGRKKSEPRIHAMTRGLIYGAYEKPLKEGKTIISKSRGWLPIIGQLEKALKHDPKFIVTVRDPRAVIASLEKKVRDAPWTVQDVGPSNSASMTLAQRVELWCSPAGLVGLHYNTLRNAVNRHDHRTLLVPYTLLTRDPMAVVRALEEKLGLEPFDGYDPNNVKQTTKEDDSVHGLDLHKIRKKIQPPKGIPWDGILDDPLQKFILTRFPDIASWALGET